MSMQVYKQQRPFAMDPDKPVIPDAASMAQEPEAFAAAQRLAATPKEEKPIPNINDLLFGDSPPESLGGQLIIEDTIQSARKGNKEAIQYLKDAIALEEVIRSQPRSDIIGTRFDVVTGEYAVDLPESVTESEKEALTPFIEKGIRLNDTLTAAIPNPKARNLLLQWYATGGYRQETLRQTSEGARWVGTGLINLFPLIEDFASGFKVGVPESLGGSGIFDTEKYNAERAQTKKSVDAILSKANNYVGFLRDYGSATNEDIKKDYIETYGEADYRAHYVLETPKGDVEIPIISSELGQELLEFGWGELSFTEQMLGTLQGGALPTTAFGARSLASGAKKIKKAERWVATVGGETWKDVDPVLVYRHLRLSNAQTGTFSFIKRPWANLTNYVGNKFKYRGSIGNVLEQDSYAAGVKKLDDGILAAKEELNMARMAPKVDELEIKQLEARIEGLSSQRNRLVNGNLGSPMFKELLRDETLVSFGYTAGYNMIPDMYSGMSQEAGGMTGGLFLALGGARALTGSAKLLYTGTDSLFSGNLTHIARETGMIFESVAGVLPFIDSNRLTGLLVNKNYAEIESLLPDGTKLTAEDRRSFGQLAEIFETLPANQRQQVISHIGEYKMLRENILKGYDVKDHDEMSRLLQESFGNASGLAGFQALSLNSLKTISLKSLGDIVFAQNMQEKGLVQQRALIGRMRELMSDTVDTEDTAFVSSWVDNLERAVDQMDLNLTNQNVALRENLEAFKTEMLNNPLDDMPENAVGLLSRIELSITPGIMDNPLAQKEVYRSSFEAVMTAINRRIEEVEKLRGTPAHARMLGVELENLKMAQEEGIFFQIKGAYAPVDAAMDAAGKSFNLTPLIKKFFVKQDELSKETFTGLFSADSNFLSGRQGKLVMRAFNSAAERSIRKNFNEGGLELDDVEYDELLTYYKFQEPTLPDGTINPDYIKDNPTVIDIAIHMAEKEGSNFDAFMATGHETDIIYRHLRDKGMSLDDAAGKPYKEAANEINSVLEQTVVEIDGQSTSIFPLLNAAREETKGVKFDRYRAGTGTSKIDNANVGPDLTTRTGGLRRRYKRNQSPELWYKPDSVSMGEYIEGSGSLEFLNEFKDELGFTWGKYTTTDGYFFDLTDQLGRDTFDGVQKAILGNFYEHWAKDSLGTLSSITPGTAASTTGYDFARAKRFQTLYETATVKVRDADGNIVERRLFEDEYGNNLLEAMMRNETDIVNLMAQNKQVADEAKKYTSSLNAKIKSADDVAASRGRANKRNVDKLQRLSETTDTGQFFTKYILNGNRRDILSLKNDFVTSLVATGMTEADAALEFNRGMQYMSFNGLLATGKVEPVRGSTFVSLTGESRTVEKVLAPEVLLQSLENKNVREIFEEIGYTDEDFEFFLNSAKYMNLIIEGSNSAIAFSREGALRGISPNEIVSRSFNLARGMVSPTYVAAEIGFRLMQQNKMSVLELAASDTRAAEIIYKMMADPETLTSKDMSTFLPIMSSFLVRELTYRGVEAPEQFLSVEDLIAAGAAEIESETEN